VIGVASDIRSRGPAVAPRPEFYLPIAQAPAGGPHDDVHRPVPAPRGVGACAIGR